MRKTLAVALCALMLFLPQCSRRTDENAGKTTITFWHSFVASTVPSLDTLIADFERAHPAIHISAQYIPTGDGLIQKLASAVQSGTAPDISWIHADFIDKLVEANALVPMKEFIEGPDSLPSGDLEDIFPSLLQAGSFRGVLYAMPMEATSLALLYNRGLFAKAGLDPDRPPQDWKELLDDTRALTSAPDAEGRRDQYGFFVPVFPASGELNIWMVLQWTTFLWQAGGDELTADRSGPAFNSPAGVKALTLWKELYDAEDFGRFAMAHDLGFASQKLAMVLDGPWNLPRYRAMKDVDWRVAPLPAGPAGRATYLAGELLAIFSQCAHRNEAWTFVKWMVGRDVQARFSMNSGYLPVRKSVVALPEYRTYLQTDPALEVYVDQMHEGRGRQAIEQHRVEFNRCVAEAIEQALVGHRDPRECLDEAAKKAGALLTPTGAD